MLTRLFITTTILGMCLTITSGVAIAADDKQETAAVQDLPVNPPPPGWDDRDRPERPRAGAQPPPRRDDVRRRDGRGRMGGPGMGPGMGGPDRDGRGMGGRMGGPGMGPGRGRSEMEPGMMGPGMGRGRGRMGGFDPMQRSDPEMYKLVAKDRELERESMELSERFRRGRASEKPPAELKEMVESVVAQHFEVRQQRRQLELTRLEKELDRLNAAIKRRQEARDDIIKRRVMQLTWEKDHLDF